MADIIDNNPVKEGLKKSFENFYKVIRTRFASIYVTNTTFNNTMSRHTHQSLVYKNSQGETVYRVVVADTGSFRPGQESTTLTLGTTDNPWSDIVSVGNLSCKDVNATGAVRANGTKLTSDRNQKEKITSIPSSIKKFFMSLTPSSYEWKDKNIDNKTHYGFIAQDVESALKENNIDSDDMGIVERPDETNGIEHYSLSYNDFIPVITKVLQDTIIKVDELEQEIKELKSENSELKSKLS